MKLIIEERLRNPAAPSARTKGDISDDLITNRPTLLYSFKQKVLAGLSKVVDLSDLFDYKLQFCDYN